MNLYTNALAVTAVAWTLILIVAPPASALRARLNALIPLVIFSVYAVVFAVKGNFDLPDRLVYTDELRYIAGHTLGDTFSLTFRTAREPLYVAFMWIVSNGGQTTSWLYLCIGATCTAVFVYGILRLVPWWQAPLIWLTTLALGFFTSYASLVARQGLSMAMLFAAICLILTGARTRWWIVLLVVSALLHWSAIPIALTIALVALTQVRLRVAVAVWGVVAILFLTGLQERFLGPVAALVPGLTNYVDASRNQDYLGGVNRRDFFLFSLAILIVGLFVVRKGAPTPWYPRLVVFYCILNTYFLLFGFINFSDRLAAYSWTLAPLVLATPFAYPKNTSGRLGTVAFLSGVLAFGFVIGPFQQMTGVRPY
jgi:hypothetical protein